MSAIDEFLGQIGIKFEDLDTPGHSGERETLMQWLDSLQKNQLTIEGIHAYIKSMRDSVEMELTTTTISDKQDMLLKARLRNYMMLEAFLTAPEKAKRLMEQQLAMIPRKK